MEFFNDVKINPPEDLHIIYEDEFDGPIEEESFEYDYEDFLQSQMPPSFNEIFQHCLLPTIESVKGHVGKLIICCIIFRISTQLSSGTPKWLVHTLSSIIGLGLLISFFNTNIIFQIGLTLSAWIMLQISHKIGHGCRGLLSLILCVSFNLICELFFATPVDWQSIRGVQMVLSMKLISIAFDMDADIQKDLMNPKPKKTEERVEEIAISKKDLRRRKFIQSKTEESLEPPEVDQEFLILKVPTFWEYFGYALCPGTTVFGPWVPYKDYLSIFNNPIWNPNWLLKVIFSVTLSLLFLTISTCWIPMFIPDMKMNQKWISAYRDAMSFRASHYFVSFMSEASSVAAGFGYKPPDGASPRSRWEVPVAEPHNIEVPRSLVDVVVSWNIPMHKWLKKYCFKNTIQYGKVVATLSTFFASTFLHGLNFQLGAVLLTLGVLSFLEAKIRQKLADLFNASIAARKNTTNVYRYREGSFVTILANLAFGILTVVHLMYLGVMFDQSDTQEEGYVWTHTVEKWQSLGFFSHYFALFALGLNFLL